MVDFYFRAQTDPNYRANIFESRNDIENTIEQVRMTLLTKKGEVLGEPDFGLDTTKYLFEFEGYPIGILEKEAASQIQDYVMLSKIYEVVPTAFNLDDLADMHKVGLALDIAINGKRTFAVLYED
jgi:hypothetical protein